MKSLFPLSHENKRDLSVLIKILSPIFFILAVSAHFDEFVIDAIKANIAINLGIILAACYGIFLILFRLRGAQKDFRVIERFGKEARQGTRMKDLLEQPWLKVRYVRHYLSHIANTGGTLSSQLDQNAIENELHALQTEYNNRLELPQFLVGFMIAMGLLGTFIGLLETLTGISGMLDGMGATGGNVEQQFMKLVVELRKPLAGMGIAFSASMFGLITSLMLAVMMINLRRYIGRVISLARNVMHELTVHTNHAPVVQHVAKGNDGGSTINNTTLAGRFDLLSRKIESVLEAFEASINSTQRMVDLLAFGPRMKELSEKTLDEIKGMSAKSSDQQRIFQTMIEINTESVRSIGTLIEMQQRAREVDDETLQALRNLSNSEIFFSQRKDQEFKDKLLSDIKNFITLQADQKKLTQSLVDLGSNNIRGLDVMATVQKETRSELATLLGRLTEAVQKVEEVQIGGARHLYDVKERLIKLCNTLNVVDLIASSISSHTVLLETLVDEVRNVQKDPNGSNEVAPTEEQDDLSDFSGD